MRWTTEPIKILGILIHPDMEIMIEINYSILLQKVRDTVMMWRKRGLTPYGKVQVVNSFVSSLYTYKFLCLPSPLHEYFDNYNRVYNNYRVYMGR